MPSVWVTAGGLPLAFRSLAIVIIPATVFSGPSFRQIMGVRKLPAVDSDAPVLFVFGLAVFCGGDHYGRLSLMWYKSQSAATVIILHIIIPNPASASNDY